MAFRIEGLSLRASLGPVLVIIAVVLSTLALAEGPNDGGQEGKNIERYAVRRVQPQYPPMAMKYRIEGEVTVSLTVDSAGKVGQAEFVRGNNIFRAVSLDAAKRWVFKNPSKENMEGTIHFVFRIEQ